MLTVYLLAPLILIGVVVFFFEDSSRLRSIYLIIIAILSALILVFRPQIHWWYYKRNPPRLPEQVAQLLMRFEPIFGSLSDNLKGRYMKRLSIMMLYFKYEAKTDDTITTDVKMWLSSAFVKLTFGLPKYLCNHFETAVFYPHKFPSPKHEPLHSSEIDYEDGVLVFDSMTVLHSSTDRARSFDVCMYEAAQVFEYEQKLVDTIAGLRKQDILIDFAEIRGFDHQAILKYTNNKNLELFGLAVEHFFSSPARFKEVLPDLYSELSALLNLDPCHPEQPIVDLSIAGKE